MGTQHRYSHQKGTAEDLLPVSAQEVWPASVPAYLVLHRNRQFFVHPSLSGLDQPSNRTVKDYNR